jgi:hypothetical protein
MISCNAHTTPLPWCPSCRLMNSIRILKEPPVEEPKIVSWSQPICDLCWMDRYPPTLGGLQREPVRITGEERDREQCADCGMPTTSGIYIRVNPMEVRYPKRILDKDWRSDEVQKNSDYELIREPTPAADL